MLKLNQNVSSMKEYSNYNLNTSHVKVKLVTKLNAIPIIINLNTSHVKVKHCSKSKGKRNI